MPTPKIAAVGLAMDPSLSLDTLLRIMEEAPSENLVHWAIEHGISRFPESADLFVDAAITLVQKDPEKNGKYIWSLDGQDVWKKAPHAAPALRQLLTQLKGRPFGCALNGLAEIQTISARDVLLEYLDSKDPEQAGNALHAISHLPDGPALVEERVNDGRLIEQSASALLEILLHKKWWTVDSLRTAMHLFADLPKHSQEASSAYDDFLFAMDAQHYASALRDQPKSDRAKALMEDCPGLFDKKEAGRIAEHVSRLKGLQAAESLLEAIPRIPPTAIEGHGSRSLALLFLGYLREDRTLRECAFKTHPVNTACLAICAFARLYDSISELAVTPEVASLQQTLEVLSRPRPNLSNEDAWTARAASFGQEALQPLARLLRQPKYSLARRAAGALLKMGTEEAISILLTSKENSRALEDWEGLDIGDSHLAFAAKAHADEIKRVLKTDDWKSVERIVGHWQTPSLHGDLVAHQIGPKISELLGHANSPVLVSEFIAAHPVPAFAKPLSAYWRPSEFALGEALELVLHLHRPDSPKLGEVREDLARQEGMQDRLIEDFGKSLNLRLRCRKCSASYFYEVTEIQLFTDALRTEAEPPVSDCAIIQDVIKCKGCGAIDTYEWTQSAEEAVMLQSFVGLSAAQDDEAEDSDEEGVIQYVQSATKVGMHLTLSEALRRTEEKANRHPDDPVWLLSVASCLFSMRRLDDALKAYEKCLRLHPKTAPAAFQCGAINQRLERFDKALASYTQAARLLTESAQPLSEMAEALSERLRETALAGGLPPPVEALEIITTYLDEHCNESETKNPELDEPPFPARRWPRQNDMAPHKNGSVGFDDFDDSLEPVEPIRASGKIIRPNDRCPCGSGKKYKKCCGRIAAPADAASAVAPPPDDHARQITRHLNEKIFNFTERHLTREERAEAAKRWSPADPKAFERARFGEEESAQFIDFLIHDWKPGGKDPRTVLERFAAREASRLSRDERKQIDDWLSGRRRGWMEVVTTDGNWKSKLRDYLTGETFDIHDYMLAKRAHRGQMVVTAIFPCGGRLEMPGIATIVPRDLRTPFESWLRKAFESWAQDRQGRDWPAFFKDRAAEIDQELRRMAEAPPKVLLSTGEPASYGYRIYDVKDHAAALRVLESIPFLQYHGRGEGNEVRGENYGWIHDKSKGSLPFQKPLPNSKETGDRVVVIGSGLADPTKSAGAVDPVAQTKEQIASVYLSRNFLEIQALSAERLDYACQTIENRLGVVIAEQRSRQHLPNFVDELWKAKDGPPVRQRPSPQPAHLASLQRDLEESHWREWLDMPIPALDDRTPRQAAAEPSLRTKLEALLLDLEEHEHYGPRKSASSHFGLPEIRMELGVE